MVPQALNWDLGGQGLQDLPHKAQTVFPLLSLTMVTCVLAPDHLPPALVKTVLGGVWKFLCILKDRFMSTDLKGEGGMTLNDRDVTQLGRWMDRWTWTHASYWLALEESVMACVAVTLPRTVTGPL